MPKCLGVYIEDNVIKYSKVDKNKDALKIESCNVEFYEKTKIVQTLEKIIRETFSAKDNISINISNEQFIEIVEKIVISNKQFTFLLIKKIFIKQFKTSEMLESLTQCQFQQVFLI